jgi:hypothetical protein
VFQDRVRNGFHFHGFPGMRFAYTIVWSADMEKQAKHMATCLFFDSRLYRSLRARISGVFLSRFSANYPSSYNAGRHESSDETTVGYEAAWVGAARQITKNNRIH